MNYSHGKYSLVYKYFFVKNQMANMDNLIIKEFLLY